MSEMSEELNNNGEKQTDDEQVPEIELLIKVNIV